MRAEDRRVDAKLRQDNDFAAVALAYENVAGLGVAGDGDGTGAVYDALEPVERRRIAAVQVLPGEEERLCADGPRRSHAEKRSQIVRFLIEMHNLRLQLPQLCYQSGIEVEVVRAVE